MQKTTLIFILALLVISGLVFGISMTLNGTKTPVPEPSPEYPVSDDYVPLERINLETRGGYIEVPNFLLNPDVVKDPVNSGYYYLGNHFPLTDGESQQDMSYVVTYISETHYFNVMLLKEPLGRARREAENYMLSVLGFAPEDFCSLNATVSTPHWVSEAYAGEELGFSFCEGSVSLPE